MGSLDRTLYVGNLPGDIRVREVEDLFYKYGPIVDIDLKVPPRPPSYAFVEFENYRDAEDAIRGRDGLSLHVEREELPLLIATAVTTVVVVVDLPSIPVLVTGLPFSASWQDLKIVCPPRRRFLAPPLTRRVYSPENFCIYKPRRWTHCRDDCEGNA